MNKIIMAPLIFLVLLVCIGSSSAIIYKETHIHGMKNVTVTQGKSFTLHIHVVFDGACREKGINNMYPNSVHLYINDLNDYMITNYDVGLPRAWGNDITVDTSNLEPGTYEMTASFDGKHDFDMVRSFLPSSKSTYLTVLPKNGTLNVPTANNMSLATKINKSIEDAFNVTDANNGILNTNVVTAPSHGNITVDGTNFVYIPDPDYEGNDTFTYKVIENSRLISNLATVQIQVLKENTANNMSISTTTNKPWIGTFNATNPYGRPLNAFLVSPPNHGNIAINGTHFVYTPDPDYEGDDTFSYKVNDSNGLVSNLAFVDVQVVDNRLNETAENFTIYLDQNRSDNLRIISNYDVVIVQPPIHGFATVNDRYDYPIIQYRPVGDYIGNDSYSYRLQSTDGRKSNIAHVNIIIRYWPI